MSTTQPHTCSTLATEPLPAEQPELFAAALRTALRWIRPSPVLTCGAVIVLAGLVGCRKTPGNDPSTDGSASASQIVFRNIESPSEFVGDDLCFDCHESEYTGYQDHGMARSYYRLTEANRVEQVEDVTVADPSSPLRYTIRERPDGLYQEEYMVDGQGNTIHRLERRMDYVVGSGTAARTYLTELNGRLYELPLTWYTQEERWDFSPGYEIANFRFDRTVPDRCMACHNSYPSSVPFVEGKYADVPAGIGCERCHGPGGLHVRERLEIPDVEDEIDDSIVNPAHLPFELRMDVCQQCHLHTTVSLLREDRSPFGYRPSKPLSDHIALFAEDDPSKAEGIDVISHADRMKQSECYVATVDSAEPLECTTCHDPHQGFRTLGEDYFNATCVGCHSEQSLAARFETTPFAADHGPPSNCFGCHMPRVEVEDAPHSSFTDHLVRVVDDSDNSAMVDPVASHDEVSLRPYFDRDRESQEGRIYHAMAQIVYGRQLSQPETIRSGVEALKELVDGDTTYSEAIFLQGLGRQLIGEHQGSIEPLELAVRLGPDNPERLNALAQSYELAGVNQPLAGRLYRRALAIQPAAARIRVNYGRFLQSMGMVDEAVAEYRRAIEEDPWLDVGHFNLGTTYASAGRFDDAEAAFQKAISLNPLYSEAIGNLAALYASQGRDGEARGAFERAVRVSPDDPTALGNLGAFRLNEGDAEAAIELLRRAVSARPVYTDAIANLSLAYFRIDDYETAREYARRAIELDSGNQLARQVLVATE